MVFEGERCLKYNKVDNNNMIGTLYNLHTFDFDGTLTKRDTLIEFIRFAKGDKFFLKCMLRFFPLLLAMKMGLYPNETVKQKVLSYCFKGMATDLFNDMCRLFARTKKGLLRKKALKCLDEALEKGDKVLIVSASVTNWVAPFFADKQGVMVVGTELEEEDGRLTGRLATRNCYGIEKVKRIKELFPDRNRYFLTAYGDSHGDARMLDYADKAYYKPFRD